MILLKIIESRQICILEYYRLFNTWENRIMFPKYHFKRFMCTHLEITGFCEKTTVNFVLLWKIFPEKFNIFLCLEDKERQSLDPKYFSFLLCKLFSFVVLHSFRILLPKLFIDFYHFTDCLKSGHICTLFSQLEVSLCQGYKESKGEQENICTITNIDKVFDQE